MIKRPELSQQELVARERRKYRRGLWLGLVFGLALVAIVFLLFSLPQSAVKATLISYFEPGLIVLLTAVSIAAYIWHARPQARAREAVEGPKLIDERQTQTRWNNRIILFVVVLLGAELASTPALRHEGHVAMLFALLTAIMSLMVCFGTDWGKLVSLRTIDDELTKAFRMRVARLGYIVVMLTLSILFLLALYQPSLVVAAMPIAMVVGAGVPILYLELLEWRANRRA